MVKKLMKKRNQTASNRLRFNLYYWRMQTMNKTNQLNIIKG